MRCSERIGISHSSSATSLPPCDLEDPAAYRINSMLQPAQVSKLQRSTVVLRNVLEPLQTECPLARRLPHLLVTWKTRVQFQAIVESPLAIGNCCRAPAGLAAKLWKSLNIHLVSSVHYRQYTFAGWVNIAKRSAAPQAILAVRSMLQWLVLTEKQT